MRLIDADKVKEYVLTEGFYCDTYADKEYTAELIDKLFPTIKAIPIVKLLKHISDIRDERKKLTPLWLSQFEVGMLEKCDIDFAEGYETALMDIIDIIKRYDYEKNI